MVLNYACGDVLNWKGGEWYEVVSVSDDEVDPIYELARDPHSRRPVVSVPVARQSEFTELASRMKLVVRQLACGAILKIQDRGGLSFYTLAGGDIHNETVDELIAAKVVETPLYTRIPPEGREIKLTPRGQRLAERLAMPST